ncbi:DUF4174 domain-containing protein [Hymenobacter arizonensis]|nr:DUF4174 domain-containing protein [Hymenobacter arizonensis]
MSLEQTLRDSRWKKRVLLVAAPTAEHADFKTQKALLAANATELAERDFLVVDAVLDQLSAADKQFLLKKIGVQAGQFSAVLIGKDGGVKEKSRRPIAPADLLGRWIRCRCGSRRCGGSSAELAKRGNLTPQPPLQKRGGAMDAQISRMS